MNLRANLENEFISSIDQRPVFIYSRTEERDGRERVCESLVCGTSERVGRGTMGKPDTEESEQRNREEKYVGKGKG